MEPQPPAAVRRARRILDSLRAEAAPDASRIQTPAQTPAPDPARDTEIRLVADLIDAAERPILLVGLRATAPDGTRALRHLIAHTELPVIETVEGAGLVSRELDGHFLGRAGPFRNPPTEQALSEADLVIAVGCVAVDDENGARPGTGATRRVVHIDSVPVGLDLHDPPVIEVRGDIPTSLDALVPLLNGLTLSTAAAARAGHLRFELKAIDERARMAETGADSVDPVWLVLRMRDILDDDATVACDLGSSTGYLARHFRVYEPRRLVCTTGPDALGVALSWALAAGRARPDTQIVSVSDDDGFLLAARDLQAAIRLGAPLTHLILRDTAPGDARPRPPKHRGTSGDRLRNFDVVSVAAAFATHLRRASSPDEFDDAFRASLAEPGVSIIEVPLDLKGSAHHLHNRK